MCSSKRWLTDLEICEVTEYCQKFGEIVPLIKKSITLKADDIIYHLPEFLNRFRTVGMFSEEDTETLHKELNAILRPIFSVRDKSKRLKLGLKRLELKRKSNSNYPDFSKPTKRKCQKRLDYSVK